MWKFIRKIFVDIIFITILYIVSYTNHDSNAFFQVQHLSNFFLNTRNSSYDFTQIISINDYWQWLQMSFIPNIRVQSWYNNEPVENMTDYIDDKSNFLIGWTAMRQLRLKSNESCRIASIIRPLISSCEDSYSIFNEEHRSFAPGWIISNNVTSSYSSSIQNAFIYRTSAELDSYIYIGNYGTYGSGGYVYEFRGNINDLLENITLLQQLSWIDELSRAVIIQLNLYNPNVNLFTSVILIIEITNIGESFPSSLIEPMQMYIQFNDFSSIFYLIIALIYILFIIYFTIFEFYSIYQLKTKYFRQIRSYIEWGIIGCSWGGVGIYISRYLEAQRIGKYFHQTNGSQYINLEFATYLNNILTYLVAFSCFFGTIRLLRLFDVCPRVNMFTRTLRQALKDIVGFSLMFFLVFFAFVVLFYLLFVSKMESCSSLLETCGMLFEMLLLKFDFYEIQNADAFLGPLAFILFIYFVVFICFTMFVAIIMGHLRRVRKEYRQRKDSNPQIMRFILRDLVKRIGWKKLIEKYLQEQNDEIMRSKGQTPMEQLAQKVDKLLNVLENIYGNRTRSEIVVLSESQQSKRRTKRHIIYST